MTETVTRWLSGTRLNYAQHALRAGGDDEVTVTAITQELVGLPLLSGWRGSVISRLRGTRGCTHVNTLLIGLGELSTMVFFLRINDQVAYTQDARDDGRWTEGALLEVAPYLGADPCHGLRSDGPAMAAYRARTSDAPGDQ